MAKSDDIPTTEVNDVEKLREPLTEEDRDEARDERVLEDEPDRKPSHPGETLKSYIEHYDLNNSRVAEILDVPRNRISKIVNGHRTISADTAIRLSMLFEETDPEFWLKLSERRELWEQRQENKDKYDELENQIEATGSLQR
ncbi:MAG: HigA family addiction module antitoxin [bacterium]